MTDDFDPTMRSREPGGAAEPQEGMSGYGLPDDTSTTVTRSLPDELVSPHDQPAEGGREEMEDVEGAETGDAEEPLGG